MWRSLVGTSGMYPESEELDFKACYLMQTFQWYKSVSKWQVREDYFKSLKYILVTAPEPPYQG